MGVVLRASSSASMRRRSDGAGAGAWATAATAAASHTPTVNGVTCEPWVECTPVGTGRFRPPTLRPLTLRRCGDSSQKDYLKTEG